MEKTMPINESLAVKHFKKALADNRIYVENHDGDLYITDTHIIIKIPGNPLQFKLFNDRTMFPELPGIGEIYTYSKLVGFNKQGPSITKLVNSLIDSNYKPLTVTPWIYSVFDDTTLRLFYNKTTPIFVNTRFLDLFKARTWYGTEHSKPIIDALNVEEITSVIMPYKVKLKPNEIFPAHLDFLTAE
jgi:hypothetical protein